MLHLRGETEAVIVELAILAIRIDEVETLNGDGGTRGGRRPRHVHRFDVRDAISAGVHRGKPVPKRPTKGIFEIEPRHVDEYFATAGKEYPHHCRATVLSLTQASEDGLVYTPKEIAALASLAHTQGMKVHMDGARFANAVAALKCAPADVSWKAGVDVLCLGATKNGALAAEVVLFFDKKLAEQFVYRRKRAGHLLSKSRFVGAQMEAWLRDGLWLKLAAHANDCAQKLSRELSTNRLARLTWPAQANEVFVVLPKKTIERLRAAGAEFYEWPVFALPPEMKLKDDESYIRLVTSFVTSEPEVGRFCALARG